MLFTLLRSGIGKVLSLNGNGFLYMALGSLIFFMVSSGLGKITDVLGFTDSKTKLSYDAGKLKNQLDTTINANNSLTEQLILKEKSNNISLDIVNKTSMSELLKHKRKTDIENKRLEEVAALIDLSKPEVVIKKKVQKNKINKASPPDTKLTINDNLDKTYNQKVMAKLANQIEKVSEDKSGKEIITIDKEKMEKISYINIKSIWSNYENLNTETVTNA